ncbi:MAG: hypothetical protein GWP58_04150 [Gammaproteobacteria bacterium]|jgi:hypothetical protein|nr:hypothetical protein [Gammaproteobacteria bacterium]
MPDISVLRQLLEAHGLVVLGEFSDRLLVGNAGSAFWSCFERSPEFLDNQPHPLDRWSQRIGRSVAAELNARVVFPFQGPPYPPVLKWASESGQAFQSPISMYIHREYGLWHAYRFILVFPEPLSGLPPLPATESPCLSCPDQPCLDACPVNAFSDGGYRVGDCVDFLAVNESSGCRKAGCEARRACPVAMQYQYLPRHAQFHMDAFLKSQTRSVNQSFKGR